MSSAPARSPIYEVSDYVRAWAKCLVDAGLASAPGNRWEVLAEAPADAPSSAPDDFWVVASLSGGLNGEIAFRMSRADARHIAGENEENDHPLTAENQSRVLDIFRHAAGPMSRQRQGADIQIQVETATTPSWPVAARQWLRVAPPSILLMEISMNELLVAGLQTIPVAAVSARDASPEKLGMLMDVELVVTVRFGGRRMLLKDILDLCTGSVVELDQQVQAPVDLLLDGKVIARGEVVVVDGNYGLRVTDLLADH
jgi:flagellar motor switch protein FliN/FliY